MHANFLVVFILSGLPSVPLRIGGSLISQEERCPGGDELQRTSIYSDPNLQCPLHAL